MKVSIPRVLVSRLFSRYRFVSQFRRPMYTTYIYTYISIIKYILARERQAKKDE